MDGNHLICQKISSEYPSIDCSGLGGSSEQRSRSGPSLSSLSLDVDAGGDASTQIDASFVLAQGCHLVAKLRRKIELPAVPYRTEAKM